MSGKQFLVLLLLFMAYLMLGAAVFHFIEQAKEIEHHAEERRAVEAIYAELQKYLGNDTLADLVDKLESYCGKPFRVDPNRADPFKWHFYNAVFFVITVVSTIGYGNLAPTTPFSRILMIFYALVGIPMNGILLKSLADYFAHFFLRARDKYRAHHHNPMSLAGSILMYVSLGIFVFIVSPSFLFMHFEGWTFDEAIYYAFVSLTTIGFGDLVAGQEFENRGVYYTLYKVFLIVWLLFGLGYLFMVLGFITDAMRSKRMAKLSKGIRQTQTKLWHGVVHEMPHLMRRVLNELYLLKVKPVYHDNDSLVSLQLGGRSSSCPDLFWLDEAYKGTAPYSVVLGGPGAGGRRSSRAAAGCRPRALSEVLPGRLMVRRRSETELARIDRRATFADTAAPTDSALDPAELLHEFMNALVNWGGGVAGDEVYNSLHKAPGTALPSGGYQGFADADILSSEWSQSQQQRQRQRAKSLAPFTAATDALAESRYGYGPHRLHADEDWDDSSTLPADEAGQDQDQDAANNAEWTWSGAGASKRVHELIRARQNRRRSEAFIRKQLRQDRRMQELHDFHRLKAFEEMQLQAKEARQREKRLRARTMSAGTVEPGSGASAPVPRTSVSGLMQRLAIPQRLKDLARRRRSLQPDADPDEDQDAAGPAAGRRRSPSYDPAPPPWPGVAADPYRTHTAGDNLLGLGLGGLGQDAGLGRRDSIFRRNSATVHPVLENTSLAEFLRVLQTVQRQQREQRQQGGLTSPPAAAAPATPGKTRKLGTAGLAQPVGQPSIFNVFPGLRDGVKPEKRRLSLRPGSPQLDPAAAAGAPTGRRRMSFWPSFGSDQTQPVTQPGGLVNGTGVSNGTAGGQRRRSSTARRLSTFFGGGTCTDPAPDPDQAEGVGGAPVKATKKRRFSIWPTLGVMGRAGGSGDTEDKGTAGLGLAEDGRASAVAHPAVPQITVTYVNDAQPPAPAPREALRRIALTSGMPGVPPSAVAPSPDSARMRLPRTSLGGVPAPSVGVPSPLARARPGPGRRGPSTPSPLSTPVTSHRRRAMSESTRTREPQDPDRDDYGEDAESERL